MWIVKIDNEYSPNDFIREKFKTLEELISFLKEELNEDDELEGYDVNEFFAKLEEEARERRCACRTLKEGSLDVFEC